MSEHRATEPFLSEFFERRPLAENGDSALGTETFTKARENADADYAEATREARLAALGTQTLTEQREDADVDAPSRRHATVAALGTETNTATREDADSDQSIRRTGSAPDATPLGTETGTRVRENADQDTAASSQATLWVANLL